MKLSTRIQKAWNAFNNNSTIPYQYSGAYGYRPDQKRMHTGIDKSVVNSIYTRIAVDACETKIEHVRTDVNGVFSENIDSGLNRALTQSANIDQSGRELILDAVLTMIDEGVSAIVPVETFGEDPYNSSSYDVRQLRVGSVVGWHPYTVDINIYNPETGNKEQITLPKSMVAISENPFYNIMNESNSTLSRLVKKLNLLDDIDNQSSSGKLDLVIQLPYSLKTRAREEQAEQRKNSIESQLHDSKYGIAYIDSTEHITQLNRPAENNLLDQVKYLTEQLYGQLGITTDVLQGTASEAVMKNYYQRTITPILDSLVDAMSNKFLSTTARTQGQRVMYFHDTFSLVSAADLAEMADKFTRNEICTSNDFRGILGMKPSTDPRADQLVNSNIAATNSGTTSPEETTSDESLPEETTTPDKSDSDYVSDGEAFLKDMINNKQGEE